MHAQQSFLNVCNTAILGYHGDKIILYKNVKDIKCHKLQVIAPSLLIKYIRCNVLAQKNISFVTRSFYFRLTFFVLTGDLKLGCDDRRFCDDDAAEVNIRLHQRHRRRPFHRSGRNLSRQSYLIKYIHYLKHNVDVLFDVC